MDLRNPLRTDPHGVSKYFWNGFPVAAIPRLQLWHANDYWHVSAWLLVRPNEALCFHSEPLASGDLAVFCALFEANPEDCLCIYLKWPGFDSTARQSAPSGPTPSEGGRKRITADDLKRTMEED
jgi:hypothetical protein